VTTRSGIWNPFVGVCTFVPPGDCLLSTLGHITTLSNGTG
jgi:hypothetical protein